MWYRPSPSVRVEPTKPVERFLTVIAVPGSTAPKASTTRPCNAAMVWEAEGAGAQSSSEATPNRLSHAEYPKPPGTSGSAEPLVEAATM